MEQQGRSANGLVDEMMEESDKFSIIGIVVKFEVDSRIILYNPTAELEDFITKLKSLMEKGGAPIGFIGIKQVREDGKIMSKPLGEFVDNLAICDYLRELSIRIAEQGIIDGYIKDVK
jgi:hypothetical protein